MEATLPTLSVSACTASSVVNSWLSSSPPASNMPTISASRACSPAVRRTFSPTVQCFSSASSAPTMICSFAPSLASSSQRPAVTSHQERMPAMPASSSSPVGRDRWWLNQVPTSFAWAPSGSATWVSRKGVKSTMLKAQKMVFSLPSSSSFR